MTEALDLKPQAWWNPTEAEKLQLEHYARAIAEDIISHIDLTGLPTVDTLARQLANAAGELASQALDVAQTRPIIDDGSPQPGTVWSSQRIEDELLRVRGTNGQPRFAGIGPPPTLIIGAELGDVYLDLASGNLYQED